MRKPHHQPVHLSFTLHRTDRLAEPCLSAPPLLPKLCNTFKPQSPLEAEAPQGAALQCTGYLPLIKDKGHWTFQQSPRSQGYRAADTSRECDPYRGVFIRRWVNSIAEGPNWDSLLNCAIKWTGFPSRVKQKHQEYIFGLSTSSSLMSLVPFTHVGVKMKCKHLNYLDTYTWSSFS